MPNMIFHIPYQIDEAYPSGSQIRPLKMIEAFEKIGYQVDVISGVGRRRARRVKEVKKSIEQGVHYDFLYSESSTMPTLLTEKSHHLPLFPFLDFSFLRWIRRSGMKVGLFYRDAFWQFEEYRNSVNPIKRWIALPFYLYDLWQYNACVDILYLPSKKMESTVRPGFKGRVEPLPAGAEEIDPRRFPSPSAAIRRGGNLDLIYVGGVGGVYGLEKLFLAVGKRDYLRLVICCRKEEWKEAQARQVQAMSDKVSVVHVQGNALGEFYRRADVGSLFLEPVSYRKFAMPLKLFEYLSYQKPILAVKGTQAGEFVEAHDLGWCIPYEVEAFLEVTDKLFADRRLLAEKVEKLKEAFAQHTWTARAEKVVRELRGSTVARRFN